MLDPKAVEKALQGYAKAASTKTATSMETTTSKASDLADALIALERDRVSTRRSTEAQTGRLQSRDADDGADLLAVGVAMVWAMLS